MILQFVAHGGELKKLQRIGKEFAEFVVYSKRKRYSFVNTIDESRSHDLPLGRSFVTSVRPIKWKGSLEE